MRSNDNPSAPHDDSKQILPNRDLETPLECTDVENLAERLAALSEAIDDYRTSAELEANRFHDRHEDEEVPPEEVPYGEDLSRTEDLPSELARAERLLDQHCSGELSSDVAKNAFEEANGIAERAQKILADCTDLPSESTDEDE